MWGLLIGGYESSDDDEEEEEGGPPSLPPPPPHPDIDIPPLPDDDDEGPGFRPLDKEHGSGFIGFSGDGVAIVSAEEAERQKIRRLKAEEWKRKRGLDKA